MRSIPLVDLAASYANNKNSIDRAVSEVLSSGWYLIGQQLNNFEKSFAQYLGVKHVVGVSSGTDALTIALKSLGLGSDDEVIIPANCYPTAFGVSLSGVKLRLADVDHQTLNISVHTIMPRITKKTRAVVVVHLYGNPADIKPIKKLCRENNIFLIEDCAQAVGAIYNNKKVGSFGDIACFSFYPTKNLGCIGDGGAIATNKSSLAKKAKLWRMYGEKKRYDSQLIGLNSRLSEIQAAVLNLRLKTIDRQNKARKSLAAIYNKGLSCLPVIPIKVHHKSEAVYHLYVLKTKKRNQLIKFLNLGGIATGIHYPKPIHLTKSFKHLNYRPNTFPVSEYASKHVVSLPIYPELSKNDVQYVVNKLSEFFEK